MSLELLTNSFKSAVKLGKAAYTQSCQMQFYIGKISYRFEKAQITGSSQERFQEIMIQLTAQFHYYLYSGEPNLFAIE